jgi:hypothetical protein
MKKPLIALLTIAVMLCLPVMSALAADTTDTGTDGMQVSIPLEGSISATQISVTHPINVAYAINPDANTLTAPDISITNNTVVPVSVTVQSLTSTTGGSIQFTDVAAADKNWASLNKADTKTYIALGIKVASDTVGWNDGYASTTHYAVDASAMTVGSLNAATTGMLGIVGNFGRAFDASYTAMHSLVLRFNLV